MSVLRTRALELFKAFLECNVPELENSICAGPAEAPKMRTWPHLAISPVRFTLYPNQEFVHDGTLPTQAVLNVGRFEGLVQLRLGATSTRMRAELESKVTNCFFLQEGRPGVIVLPVPECPDAIVAWELDADEWSNEAAFTKQWYSIMTVTVQIPALVTRDGVYTIEDLQLILTDDLTTAASSLPDSKKETVQVLEDGTIELVP